MTRSATFVLEPLPDIDTLEKLWRGFDRGGAHSFFLTWTWIGTLLRTTTKPPLLVKVLRGSELAGLALLTQRQGWLHKLLPIRQAWLNATGHADLDGVTIEHNGFALPSGNDTALWPAFVSWFAQERFADELIVPGIDPEEAHGGRKGLYVLERRKDGFRTPLGALGEGGIASLISSNARQQLRRSLRDYGDGLVLDRAHDSETALSYFAGLKELHAKSWTRRGRRHAFDGPFFETFHRALIAAGMDDDSVDLLRVRAGERAIGYLYNFRRNGVVSSYQSGFDDEAPGLRPGYVCHALAMAHYARMGESTYDFLAGTNRLKQSFGTEKYELCWRHYRQPTLGFRAEHLARKAVRIIRRRPHGKGS
jgi:CelD/BcsL family acetyltransferase involved in cellulose biosynthesis